MDRTGPERGSPSVSAPRRIAVGMMVSAATLVAGLLAASLLPGSRLPALVAGAVAGVAAWAMSAPLERGGRPAERMAGAAVPAPAAAAPPPAPDAAGSDDARSDDARARALRHDLRGILSPAMMMADRLLMTTEDPVARRCADVVIASIERAERRLSGPEAGKEGRPD